MKAKPKTGTWAQIAYFVLEVITGPQSEVAELYMDRGNANKVYVNEFLTTLSN